jgi:membrane protein required for colicin V production
MQFTIVDGGVALVLFISGVLAYSRGITRELLAIAGWIIAAIAAIYFAPMMEPILKEIPVVGEFLVNSCSISKLAAVAAVFALALIILSIFTPLFSSAIQESPLGGIDRGLGFLFGVARGVVLVAVVYLLYNTLIPDAERIAMIDDARTVKMISDASEILQAEAPTSIPRWIAEPVNKLMADCGGVPGLTPDAASGPASTGAATSTPEAPATTTPGN